MGKSTVKLVHRTWDFYSSQVDMDMEVMQASLVQWLTGDAATTPPAVSDATDLLNLMQGHWGREENWSREDCDAWAEIVLKRQHRATTNPLVSTVGQLIERLQGLDPDLPISLVVGEQEGHIDLIEVH